MIVDGDDIYGDGVNVAARLEGLAEPGGILVAGVVRDQVRDKLSFSFDDLGDRNVKNIPRPVRAYRVKLNDDGPPPLAKPAARVGLGGRRIAGIVAAALLLIVVAGGGAWYVAGGAWTAAPVAEPAHRAPGQTCCPTSRSSFCPSPTCRTIRSRTISLTELHRTSPTICRASSGLVRHLAQHGFRLQGEELSTRKQIGKELGCATWSKARCNAIRAACRSTPSQPRRTGGHLWLDRFDKPLGDLFALQDEIVAAVASELKAELISNEARRAERAATPPIRWTYIFRVSHGSIKGRIPRITRKRVAFLNGRWRSIPNNLDAVLAEANVDMNLAYYQSDNERAALLATADLAVTHVLSRAPNNASAHYLRGRLLLQTNREAEGIAELERTLALSYLNFAWVGA